MRTIEICRFCDKNIWPWQKMVVEKTIVGWLGPASDKENSWEISVNLCRHGICNGSAVFYEGLLWKLRHPILWFRKYVLKETLTGSK